MEKESFYLTQKGTASYIRSGKDYWDIYRAGFLVVLFLVSILSVSAQSRPSHSRYVDNERWSKDDCMARARGALETENYRIEWTGVDAYQGYKGPYSAFILCNPTPDGTMRVNVIIAGNTASSVPESDRLWIRLRNPATDGTGGTGNTTGGTTNLALNRPATQSSFYAGAGGKSETGVDGVKDGQFGFHTNNDPNAWWQVDLGAVRALSEVRIFNRLGSWADRAKTIQVLLSDDGVNWTRVYAHDGSVFGGTDGKPLRVYLNGKTARYVRLQLNETNYLHLDEVEIYPFS